ncbi:MAG TPA: hypothetical protein VF127_06635 [Nitrospira sp.]
MFEQPRGYAAEEEPRNRPVAPGTDDDDIRAATIRHLDNVVRRIPKSRRFKNPIAGFRESLSCTVHEALSGGFYVGISNDMA